MASQTVTCVRCKATLPQSQADFSADGMLCRACSASAEIASRLGGKTDVAGLERALARSTARKHVLIGIGSLLLGIGALSLGASDVVVIPIGLLVGGVAELMRGVTGMIATAPEVGKRTDSR